MTGRVALIAGRGDLPAALAGALSPRPVVCALMGQEPNGLVPDNLFRLETLGSLIATLSRDGVTDVCLCGGIERPEIDPAAIDAETLPLIPVLKGALAAGDDGALRAVMGLFEARGMTIRAAHEIAPSLLAPSGRIGAHEPDAMLGANLAAASDALSQMAKADLGQAVILRDGAVLAREDERGTDALLADMAVLGAAGAILVKAPKPGQDLRADLPTIGPDTVKAAKQAGLSGIVVAAGASIVLDRDAVIAACDAAGLFLYGADPCTFS